MAAEDCHGPGKFIVNAEDDAQEELNEVEYYERLSDWPMYSFIYIYEFYLGI